MKKSPPRIRNFVALVLVATAALGADKGRPDFSGQWELDSQHSDDPMEKLIDAIRRVPPNSRRPPTVDENARDDAERLIRWLEEGIRSLRIEHDEPALTLVNARDLENVLYSDGRDFLRRGPRYQSLDAKGKWKKNRLLITSKRDEGGRIVETFELSDDGKQLFIIVQLSGRPGSPAVAYRRIYNRGFVLPESLR